MIEEEDLKKIGAKFNGSKAEIKINDIILRFGVGMLNYERVNEYNEDPIYGWDFVELISETQEKKRAEAKKRRRILLEIWENLYPAEVSFFKGHATVEDKEYVFLFRKEEDVCRLAAYEKEGGGSYRKVGTLFQCGVGRKAYTTFSKECEW